MRPIPHLCTAAPSACRVSSDREPYKSFGSSFAFRKSPIVTPAACRRATVTTEIVASATHVPSAGVTSLGFSGSVSRPSRAAVTHRWSSADRVVVVALELAVLKLEPPHAPTSAHDTTSAIRRRADRRTKGNGVIGIHPALAPPGAFSGSTATLP